MNIEKIGWEQMLEKTKDKEGFVALGTGGDLNEWVNGIAEQLKESGSAESDKPEELFEAIYEMTSTGGRTDLMFVFKEDVSINMDRMAIWMSAFGDISLVSDFKVNYADHYGVKEKDEENTEVETKQVNKKFKAGLSIDEKTAVREAAYDVAMNFEKITGVDPVDIIDVEDGGGLRYDIIEETIDDIKAYVAKEHSDVSEENNKKAWEEFLYKLDERLLDEYSDAAYKMKGSIDARIKYFITQGKSDKEIINILSGDIDINEALNIVMHSDIYPKEFFEKFEKIKIVYLTSKDGEEAKVKAYEKAKELKRQGWTVKVKKVGFRDLARATSWFVYGVRYKTTEDPIKASRFTRMASTDEQEESIRKIEKWAKQIGVGLSGGTTIGKAPQTVIIDINYQDSAIYVNRDGEIEIFGREVNNIDDFKDVLKERNINVEKLDSSIKAEDDTYELEENLLSEYLDHLANAQSKEDVMKIYEIYYDGDHDYMIEDNPYMIDNWAEQATEDATFKEYLEEKGIDIEDDAAVDAEISTLTRSTTNFLNAMDDVYFGNSEDFVRDFSEEKYAKELVNYMKKDMNQYEDRLDEAMRADEGWLIQKLEEAFNSDNQMESEAAVKVAWDLDIPTESMSEEFRTAVENKKVAVQKEEEERVSKKAQEEKMRKAKEAHEFLKTLTDEERKELETLSAIEPKKEG